MASQDIGDLGPRESSPAAIHWRWYYHLPSLGLWVLLVALLVLVKSNRRAQAWLIWLPVLAVSLGWSMLARLLFLPPESAEPFGGFLVALAASWAVVWLLAPWLARCRVWAALLLATAAMLAAGGVFYFSVCDFASPDGPDFWSVLHVAGALALLVATVLGAYSCRTEYQPRRFMVWLLLWMIAVPVLSIPVTMLVAAFFGSDGLIDFVRLVVMALISSVIGGALLGVVLYLVNLPFLFLAMRNPFYRARFHDVLRLTPAVPEAMSAAASTGEMPTLEAVMATMVKEP